MAEMVNLRTVRKQRARAADREKIKDSQVDKELATAEVELERRRLEGHRLERPEE